MFYAWEIYQAAGIPFIYAVLCVILLIIYARNPDYYPKILLIQRLLVLFLPFFLTLVTGGFFDSSVGVVWSFLGPTITILLPNKKNAWYWFAAYVVLILLSILLTPFIPAGTIPQNQQNGLLVLNIIGLSANSFVILNYMSDQGNKIKLLLREEQKKSEELLLNVLPKEIVPYLKDNREVYAERFDAISVLYADIAGFTTLSKTKDPHSTVLLLNQIFRYFDSQLDEFDVEKIRTIGDNYMVCSGAPRRRADHCQMLARYALKIMNYLQDNKNDIEGLKFRLGMNTGDAVAGVIGTYKYHYDIWSDAVNTASRMESHGIPGKIQVTKEVYETLKNDFIFESRGTIDVKGVGEMETWFLISEK